jgi:hypothetical protein
MNGPSGFREVRSSISRSSTNRLLHEQRHHLGIGARHLLRTWNRFRTRQPSAQSEKRFLTPFSARSKAMGTKRDMDSDTLFMPTQVQEARKMMLQRSMVRDRESSVQRTYRLRRAIMMRCRGLGIVLLSALVTGCAISPYAEKPTCPDPGALQTRECYYTLRMVKNTNPGWASGKIDPSTIVANNENVDWIDWGTLTRQFTPVEKYPEFIYNFPVVETKSEFTEGSLAHFVSKPNSSTLVYLTDKDVCARKKQAILKHAEGKYDPSYEKKQDPYPIPKKEIEDCPELAHVWDSPPK